MNGMLADELAARGLSLTSDFAGTIAALREIPVDAFESGDLPPIDFCFGEPPGQSPAGPEAAGGVRKDPA